MRQAFFVKEIQEQGVKVTRAKSEEGFILLSDLHPISIRAGAYKWINGNGNDVK